MPAKAAPEAEAEPDPVPVEVPDALNNPRATMRTFLKSMNRGVEDGDEAAVREAISTLDFSDMLPAEAQQSGRHLAIMLKEIIDRIRYVEYAMIHKNSDGPAYVFYEDDTFGAAIVIAPDDAGAWRFTPSTVSRIERMYHRLSSDPVVAGVTVRATGLSDALQLRSKLPGWLKYRSFLMENWQWIALALLLVVGWLLYRVTRYTLFAPLSFYLKRRELRVPKKLLMNALKPTRQMVLGAFWGIITPLAGLPSGLTGLFIIISQLLITTGAMWLGYRVVDVAGFILKARLKVVKQLDKESLAASERFNNLMVPLMLKSSKLLISVVGIVFLAEVIGISPSSLLAGLGLGGLAMALAAQDTVKNLFGSLTVIMDRPFEVGDAVIIEGFEGFVEDVGFRSTRIRTYDKSLISVPNSTLITATVENLGAREVRRYKLYMGVTYDTPPARIAAFVEGCRRIVDAQGMVLPGTGLVTFTGLGAFSLDIELIVQFRTNEYGPMAMARHALLLDIVTLANQMGIDFAYPTQSLQLSKADDVPPSQDYESLTPKLLQRAAAEGAEAAKAAKTAKTTKTAG